MNFNNHSNLEGQHAFLGASKYHWINYSEDKVAEAYSKFLATQKGTELYTHYDKVESSVRERYEKVQKQQKKTTQKKTVTTKKAR